MSNSKTDVKIFYTEDDIKKVQTKSNLYLQKYGDLGIFHLLKEVIQNSLDEYHDPDCIYYLLKILKEKVKFVIRITHDVLTDLVTVEDFGRGIPEDDYPVDIVVTKLQSGSKFYRDQGGASSGEFGVGITVTNALSSEFTITTFREDYFHKVSFRNGEKVEDIKEPIKKGKKVHGTRVSFKAEQKYFGKGSKLPMDKAIDWLEEISYQMNDNIVIDVAEYKGVELISETKIKKKPFSDLIKKFITDENKIAFSPVSFGGIDTLEEFLPNGTSREKTVNLEFAFAYDTGTMDSDYESFCNFTRTDEGGVHVDAVEDAICKYLQNKTISNMSDRQKEATPITRQDVKSGLKLAINLSTNAQVQFMGNAKNKIQNENLKPVIREIARKNIENYFEKNPAKLQVVEKIIRLNAKARLDMQKIKSVKIRTSSNSFNDLENPNLIKCNNTGSAYKELLLIEGKKSAAGSVKNGRDPWTQAIYGFRGQTKNPLKCSRAELLSNLEWKYYLEALRVKPEPDFDIRKLYYSLIGILTDADIDGYIIALGIAAFHVVCLPKIIEAGILYRIYAPLYKLDDPNHPFVGSKVELTELYLKNIGKEYKIRSMEDKDYKKQEGMAGFLYNTINYLDVLGDAVDFYKVETGLIEIVAAALTASGVVQEGKEYPILTDMWYDKPDKVRDVMRIVQAKYPETVLEGDLIRSAVAGRGMYTLHLNNRFMKRVADLIPVYQDYGYKLGVKEKHCEDRIMTIGEFLSDAKRLVPKTLSRFKGLGEADAEDIWETTLNPANRIMVRLTFDQYERDLEMFNKLKSDKLIYRRYRRSLMENYSIPRDELDT